MSSGTAFPLKAREGHDLYTNLISYLIEEESLFLEMTPLSQEEKHLAL